MIQKIIDWFTNTKSLKEEFLKTIEEEIDETPEVVKEVIETNVPKKRGRPKKSN